MKIKRVIIMMLSVFLIFSMTACGEKEEKSFNTPVVTEKEEPKEPEEAIFKEFSGDYFFSSGAGGWSTDVTINDDGTFSGVFKDFDMGDSKEEYPNGTVYICEFNGKFSKPEKKDDFTYTCSLEEITQQEEKGGEKIDSEEGVKYIYSDPYGFDNAKEFEFYLPGKSVADCSPEFLTWMMGLRYNIPYPDTLLSRAFNNLSKKYGFEEVTDYSKDVEANYPESLPLVPNELGGAYTNKNLGIVMYICMYKDYAERGDGWGFITWDIPENVIGWNYEATIFPSDNGFDVKPEIFDGYKIIVTDNTSEKVVVHLYDDRGRDCGEYVMTEHFDN